MSEVNTATPVIEKAYSLEEISHQRALLEIQEQQNVEKMLRSTKPEDILKAQTYISGIKAREESQLKSQCYSGFY